MVPNGFLLAASSLGLPPRPLKNPPAVDEPAVLVELEPNRLPPDDGCCPNTLPLLGCWPKTGVAVEQPKPDGCPKLNPVDEDVVVLLPNTDPCPNPELCPNAGAVLCCAPNSPVPLLLAVLALLVPKEKELALLAVAAPKRPPPVVALLELAPNADCPKEKPLDVPVLLAGWPKPLTWPNTDLPKPVPADVPNPAEPNPVDAGGVGAEEAEEAGGAAGCPNTLLATVVVALLAVVGVGVVAAVATVLITGVTPRELLSVVAGGG